MPFVFTKGAGKYDRMDVVRDSGEVETVDCPKQGIIPHDMVHYAVEATLRRRGFLGRVAQGEAAGYRMQPEAGSDGIERLVEVFQGDAWSGGGSTPCDMLDLYRVTCEERGCPMLDVSAADVEAVRGMIQVLTSEWNALGVGGSMRLELPGNP